MIRSILEVPFTTALCLALGAVASAQAPVVINEFSYNSTGTDGREFVELCNGSANPVDVSGWMLVHEDPGGVNNQWALPPGTILSPGAFWVMGSAAVLNVDQVIGTTNILENSNESLTLRDGGGNIVDTLVYESKAGVWDPALVEGDGLWPDQFSSDPSPTSWSRLVDGWDTDRNGHDFRIAPETPGFSNNLPLLVPYGEVMDPLPLGQPLPQWGGGFTPPLVMDPQVADPLNPQPFPQSPQGGQAAVFGDPQDLSNHTMLLCSPMMYAEFNCFVFLDLSTPGAVWTLGLHGSSGTFFDPPQPLTLLGGADNGDTGLCVTLLVTAPGQGQLVLVDNNDGGVDHVVLGVIPVLAGLNDGWQALHLVINDFMAELWFGGTYGAPDGDLLSGGIASPLGGIYVSSRIPALGGRHVCMDAIEMRIPDGVVGYTEAGVPTTVGLPQIEVNVHPRPGSSGFEFLLHDLVPNNLVLLAIGFDRQHFPLMPLGGLPGSNLFVTPDIVEAAFSDPLGHASVPLPIPPDPSYGGMQLHTQAFDFDANLPSALKVGHTNVLAFNIFGGVTPRVVVPAPMQGTNVCVYNYLVTAAGPGFPLAATGQICVNCPLPAATCSANHTAIIQNARQVPIATLRMTRAGGPGCVPNCPAGAITRFNFW